ncbi:MAG: hypothetical protein O9267_02280 [Flavobacterium sp.]|uniref:hypothetical protein n=1 Tax=Flavobacterium sp. TaxID=239 RepID=UPI0022C9E5A9|nr:hypothetical protein [Flavobacterium sp.]MCZ8196419.1 hypothetical protein [Flavobacterium sp.]
MKTQLKKIAILFISLLAISCSKDDDNLTPNPTPVVYQEENFLNTFLSTSGLDQVVQTISDENYSLIEYLEFSATQKGKITSLSFKVPATTTLNSVILRIVDAETGSLVKEISTSSSDYTAGTIKTVTVSPAIELTKDKKYRIGMVSKSTYERKRSNSADVAYPIQVGNIKLWGFSETDINTSVNTNNPGYYYGDFSFTFLRTE